MKNKVMLLLTIISLMVFITSAGHLKRVNGAPRAGALKSISANPIVALSLVMSKELRQVIASYIWLRIDEYFHSTAISFRQNREIVPLIKLVTVFDPSFIDAYLVLAHHLVYHLDRKDEGRALLLEGIEKNLNPPAPKVSELFFEAGWFEINLYKNTDEAILCLNNGLKYLSAEYDTDNLNLAIKLLSFLNKSKTDTFEVNLKYNELNKYFESITNKDNQTHAPGGEDDDDHGDGNSEHRYAGQNPWHNIYLFQRLKRTAFFYIITAITLFSILIFFRNKHII